MGPLGQRWKSQRKNRSDNHQYCCAVEPDGYDPNLMLILRHAGSDTNGLSTKLGTAASLTVEETDYGPKLRRWKPFSTLAVKPRIAFDDLTAITPAPHPRRAQLGEVPPGVKRNLKTTP